MKKWYTSIVQAYKLAKFAKYVLDVLKSLFGFFG